MHVESISISQELTQGRIKNKEAFVELLKWGSSLNY